MKRRSNTWENTCWWWTIPRFKEKADSYFLSYKKLGYKFQPDNLDQLYKPFTLTEFDKVKIVIVTGRPPWKGNGLGPSLAPNKKIVKYSAQSIIKEELWDDLKIPMRNFDLTPWARKGILLINRKPLRLSFKKGENRKWADSYKQFPEWVIRNLSTYHKKLVFIFIGQSSASLVKCVDRSKHLVICTSATKQNGPFVEPFLTYRSFKGSKIFSRTCKFLNIKPDIWRLE